MQGRKYTRIQGNKVLDAWLAKAGYDIPLMGVKVPTKEFGELITESQRSHPNYDEESHIAWAAYTCIMRTVKPKTTARAYPKEQAVLLEMLSKTQGKLKTIGRILLVILFVLLIGVIKSFGQVNHFPIIIEMQQDGVREGIRGSGLIILDCTTNLTCTFTEATHTLDISASGAAGAPSNLEYLVLTLDAGLSAERNFVAGVGIGSVDSGADAPFTISLDLAELVANQVMFDGGQATQTITFSLSGATDPVVTLADGVFNITTGTLQQNGDDVIHKDTNTLLSTENVILDGSTNPRDITLGIIRILQTPNIDSTRGIAIITDAAGFGDTKSLEVDWTATGVAAGDFEAVIDIDIDTANSSGGVIIGLEITETTTGSATTYGMLTGVGINPILNEAGVFGNIETAFTFDSVFTDVTADFNSTGSDVQMFVSNGDLVYIGMAALFDEVEFILAVTASNAGIQPTFEYSDGATGWITFSPTDNTNGMRQNGDLVWIATSLAGWAQDTVNAISGKFWIRITRGAVTVSTPPTEDLVQVNADLDFVWDSSGNLNVASVSSGFNTEIADAGFIRCANNEICMAWELATPGSDKTILVDASDIFQANGTFNATALTQGGTAVVLETRTLTGGDGIETLGDLSANRTVAVDLNATVDGVGSASNLSGMEFTATSELALLQGCADTQILKYTTTGDLWECQNDNDSGGAPAWEALVNSADTATLYTSNNVLELMDYNFTASYGASDIGFQVSQLTGNPVAGSILADFRAADADIVVLRAGDGTNGVTVSQAGALTAEGTGTITATDLAASTIDATGEFDPALCAASQILERQGAVWACTATPAGGNVDLLDGSVHQDTLAGTVVLGDIIHGNVTPAWARLAGNITTTKQFLTQTGSGAASVVPVWAVIATGDMQELIALADLTDVASTTGTGTVALLNSTPTIITPSFTTGFTIGGVATTGRYPRGNGTNFVQSSGAASGTGTCTNQFAQVLNDDAAPTCDSVVLTTDVSGILPNANGGTGIDTSGSTGVVRVDSGTTTVTELSGDVVTSGSNATLIQAGVVASAELATANKTFDKSIDLIDPTTAEDDLIQWMHRKAVTYTDVDCSTDTGTVTIDMDHRVLTTPNTVGTDILTGTIVCDTDNQVDGGFADATIPANVPVNLSITATSGSPGVVRIHIGGTVD